eukprot:SAG11_NODE_33461_length_277_cov_0.584270_1_plen_48_part_10
MVLSTRTLVAWCPVARNNHIYVRVRARVRACVLRRYTRRAALNDSAQS